MPAPGHHASMPAHPPDPEREARLAQALRENLKRRKAQSRAREAERAPIAASPEPHHREKTPDKA